MITSHAFLLFYFIMTWGNDVMSNVYSSRSWLNETYYGRNRYAVENFIDHQRMNLFERLLKRHKHLFTTSQDKSPSLDSINYPLLFDSIFTPNDVRFNNLKEPSYVSENGHTIFDRALHVLKSNSAKYNSTACKNLMEELEAYVSIRNKIIEYASVKLNRTIVPSMSGESATMFYYGPNFQHLYVNKRGYIRLPHFDQFQTKGPYSRPLVYQLVQDPVNSARLFTATLYFHDIAESEGGVFEWYDFPSNTKLAPAKSEVKFLKDGSPIINSPSFADPLLNISRVQPRKGKLLLFSAQDDMHGVREYSGGKERWAVMFGLSDKSTIDYVNKNNGKLPPHLASKSRPIL